MNVVFRCL